jgi:anti-sigma factor RsiW
VRCDEIADLLHAFGDGELDLVRNLQVERHLQECPTCAAAVRQQQALHEALSDPALYHRPAAGLRGRVLARLRSTEKLPRPRSFFPWRGATAVAASVAFLAVATWAVLRALSAPSAEELLAQQVHASHVRSLLEKGHLVDVPSSDRHKVKPWFARRVEFSPPVPDLSREGFELVGGRLDYLDNRKAAALVYKRREHLINLFVWPAAGRSTQAPRSLTVQGYNVLHWTDGDLTYWAVSDLNEQELRELASLVRAHVRGRG